MRNDIGDHMVCSYFGSKLSEGSSVGIENSGSLSLSRAMPRSVSGSSVGIQVEVPEELGPQMRMLSQLLLGKAVHRENIALSLDAEHLKNIVPLIVDLVQADSKKLNLASKLIIGRTTHSLTILAAKDRKTQPMQQSAVDDGSPCFDEKIVKVGAMRN